LKETIKPIFLKQKQHQAMKLEKKINKKQYQSALFFKLATWVIKPEAPDSKKSRNSISNKSNIER
jgi:hypothetical protein